MDSAALGCSRSPSSSFSKNNTIEAFLLFSSLADNNNKLSTIASISSTSDMHSSQHLMLLYYNNGSDESEDTGRIEV
jgi:hypothetical protein